MNQLKSILCIVLALTSVIKILAQAKNDYNWILGYPPNNPSEYYGGVRIDFNDDLPTPRYFETKCSASAPAVLSSNSGSLLAYSNGCSIYNANHESMHGGDTIAYGAIWESYCDIIGYPGTQNNILLPWPGNGSKAILLYLKSDDNFSPFYLLYSTIEFDSSNQLGFVAQKDVYLITPGTTGLLTAAKHANGRDWWVLLPENNTNRFFTFLLDPTGISQVDSQSIGYPWEEREWASQAIFTPDGQKYVRFNPWKGLDIFDFDRCTGKLSNPIESGPLSNPIKEAGGVAASFDSRYLYVSNNTVLYQFDLHSEDILGSRVTIDTYDGFEDPFPTTFYQMALAPDGKIYMVSTNGVKSLGVINHPELKGISCNFVQHGLKLPAHVLFGSINLPFFRLGPDDESLCDTLGLNNLPIADFRYEIDSIDPLKVKFRNLSYFEPETFYWTFGNTMNSSLEDPSTIEYATPDKYEVCLTVTNQYGENSFCRIVDLEDTVSVICPLGNIQEIKIKPNPFQSKIEISFEEENIGAYFELFSILGVRVFQEQINEVHNTVNVSSILEGIYFYNVRQGDSLIQTGKLIKVD